MKDVKDKQRTTTVRYKNPLPDNTLQLRRRFCCGAALKEVYGRELHLQAFLLQCSKSFWRGFSKGAEAVLARSAQWS
jgi:hypothetical protein